MMIYCNIKIRSLIYYLMILNTFLFLWVLKITTYSLMPTNSISILVTKLLFNDIDHAQILDHGSLIIREKYVLDSKEIATI